MKWLKIIATAKMYGPARALVEPISILKERGHQVMVYATGNEKEVKAFEECLVIHPQEEDYKNLVKGKDFVLAGISGYNTADTGFIKAANSQGIPSIGVNDQNYGYSSRFDCLGSLPTLISLMNKECLQRIREELPSELVEEIIKRSRIIGWTAYDSYARLKEEFTMNQKQEFLQKLDFHPEAKLYVHFTQNIHPDTSYWNPFPKEWPLERRKAYMDYEMKCMEAVFQAARDLNLRLVVKPHPGEQTKDTQDIAQKYGFTFLPAESCDTKKLMLASYSVSAGRSSCLAESCLFDKPTGAILPDLEDKERNQFPPVANKAIPYAGTWEEIQRVVRNITSEDFKIQQELAEQRKSFSVDGKASQRLVELIEEICL